MILVTTMIEIKITNECDSREDDNSAGNDSVNDDNSDDNEYDDDYENDDNDDDVHCHNNPFTIMSVTMTKMAITMMTTSTLAYTEWVNNSVLLLMGFRFLIVSAT